VLIINRAPRNVLQQIVILDFHIEQVKILTFNELMFMKKFAQGRNYTKEHKGLLNSRGKN
jgi:hypothetical protein